LKRSLALGDGRARLLSVEVAASFVTYLGVLGFAGIPTILMRDVGITTGGFALYNAAFAVVLLVISVPAGLLARRYGSSLVVFAGLVVVALSDVAFGAYPVFSVQLVSRVALGGGACLWWVSAPENIVHAFGKKNAALPLAVWLCGYICGAAASYPLTVLGAETIGWRYAYAIFGVAETAVAVAYFVESRRRTRGSMSALLAEQHRPASGTDRSHPLFAHRRERRKLTLALGFSMLLQYFYWIGILTFFPLYLVSSGFGLVFSDILGFALVIIGVPATIFGGLLSFRLKRTGPTLTAGLALGVLVVLLPAATRAYASSPYPLLLLTGAMGLALFFPDVSWTYLGEVLPISSSGSLSFAIASTFGFAGIILGSYLPPLVLGAQNGNWAYVWGLYGAASAVCLAVVAAFLLRAEARLSAPG
jgi:MFS family permease